MTASDMLTPATCCLRFLKEFRRQQIKQLDPILDRFDLQGWERLGGVNAGEGCDLFGLSDGATDGRDVGITLGFNDGFPVLGADVGITLGFDDGVPVLGAGVETV